MGALVPALVEIVQPFTLLLILGGVTAGLLVGAIPGLTATMALALLLPFTFTMDPLQGLVALGAVYMGAIYGGSFAAILINTPGTPSSIATTFDGYPLTKQGRAEEAIMTATVASAIGGVAGVGFLLLLAPPLARFALRFGPSENFWVAMLGLTLIASLGTGSLLKGLLGGALGVLIGTIGLAPVGGEVRFSFGLPVLQGGVALIVALIGLFVIPELFTMASKGTTGLRAAPEGAEKSSFLKAARAVFAMPGNLIRSSIIGEIISVIPGAGGSISNLVAYNEAKRFSKTPEKFGTGHIEGLVASETANNVTVAGSMVPLLTLGIPGAPPDAVIFGVMLLHGLRPGIALFSGPGATLTYGFILSMGFAALMMVPVGVLGGRLIYRAVAATPAYFLLPSIATITILGTFALRNTWLDVLIMLVLGTVGYFLKRLGIDPATIVLGLILGSIAEIGYVQTTLSAMAYDYPFLKLFESTLSRILITLTVLSLLTPVFTGWLRKRRGDPPETPPVDEPGAA